MQNQDENEPLWILIWRKGWQTQDWLTTSFFSGILLIELHKIIIAVYPLYLSEIWIFLGLQSIVSVFILNILLLVVCSLLLGWLIYSIHLASLAIQTFENEYQPLVDMWKVQNPNYYDLLKKIITQETLVSLTQWLNHEEIPESIKEYLRNEETCENIEKVISLLQLIFTSENRDPNTKQQILELLKDNFENYSQAERIENFCQLGVILWDGLFLDSEKFLNILKNSSLYSQYLLQLENAHNEPDLLQQLLENPRLMVYYSKYLELYPDQPQQVKQLINNLISYFNNQAPDPIINDTFSWSFQTYGEDPDIFIPICNKIYSHPNPDFIEQVISQNHQLLNFDKHFLEILDIESPKMDMLPCIHGMLYFKVPLSCLSQSINLKTLDKCLECCLNHFPNFSTNDILKIIDKIDSIDEKLKKHPDRLVKIINNIFHPKSFHFFKIFDFKDCKISASAPTKTI